MIPVIFALAWPTMLEQIMQTAVQYIDTAMVGSIGTEATAAVGATVTINWLINSTISALGVGFLAFIAQAYGAGDYKKAAAASSQAVLAVLVCGSFFTVLTLSLSKYVPVWMQVEPSIRDIAERYFFILYAPMLFRTATIIFGTLLRAVGDTKTPMLIGLWVNIINVILNFAFIYPTRTVTLFSTDIIIYGAGLGVIGAALASAIAFVVGGILITAALFKHPVISPKGKSIKPDWAVLKPCLKVALPNALQRFGTSLGYVAFAAMVNSLGEISTAAHTIANTVESAFYIPGYGMQTAAATLAGNALGARDRERIRSLGRMIILIETLLMIASGSLLFIFAENMMGLFSKDAEVILLGTTVLKMVALSEPFYGVPIIIEGMMQGMG
ncbi:MAG: MATE family efflux transporter, partial [Oscillospiraceae bacterium]|nr:MATE family efflux transporter [Oscillospiraceae bacterium]